MRLLGPILTLATLYYVFIYQDGALFMELSDRLEAWIADLMMDNVPQ